MFLTFLLFKNNSTGFLPDEDKGAVFTQIQLPDGSSASRTDMVTKEVEKKIQKIPGVRETISLVGFSGENTCLKFQYLSLGHIVKNQAFPLKYFKTIETRIRQQS